MTTKEKIIELLKDRRSGKIDDIEISTDEVDAYYHDDIPAGKEIDYNEIAEYIIRAYK